MSDYTKVNLHDVKDMAAKWGLEGLEARFATPRQGPTGWVLAIGAPHVDDAELHQGWWTD